MLVDLTKVSHVDIDNKIATLYVPDHHSQKGVGMLGKVIPLYWTSRRSQGRYSLPLLSVPRIQQKIYIY